MISFNDWLDLMRQTEQRVPLISWGSSHEKVAKMYAEHCVCEARNDLKADALNPPTEGDSLGGFPGTPVPQRLYNEACAKVTAQAAQIAELGEVVGRLTVERDDLETERDEWKADATAYARREDRDD